MKKNTRTLLITLISFIVVIVIAAVAYESLKDNTPSVSFVPDIAVNKDLEENTEEVASKEPDTTVDQEVPAVDQQTEEAKAVMPDIPLTRLDGTFTSFDAVREGKPAIINYFASWCPPCKQELPHFQQAYDQWGDQISFIFLDALDGQRETLETVKAFVQDFPFTGPVYYDDGTFAYLFQTTSLPTTVFFNADGTILKGYLGFVSEEVLKKDIAELLDL
ncbi:MAG: TlpA disulfide reductase family protein [Sphaerochaeta sp.]